jgi:hypothetical protein
LLLAYGGTNTQKTELRENGFIRLKTHDTSLVEEHIPNIQKFADDLQEAVNAAWPDRHHNRYSEAHVLLLSWEDDNLGVDRDIRELGQVFSRIYRFHVHEFRIPRKTPGKATIAKVSTFLENDRQDSLLIVYYAGHGRLSHQTNEPPIWAAWVLTPKAWPGADNINRTDKLDSPTLPSGGIQQLFEEAESDILMLYDSCHSSHPAVGVSGQGVTQLIAACGFETQAPAVGPHSFTTALIRALEESFAGPPFSVADLHSRIIGCLKNWKPALLKDDQGNIWLDGKGRPKYECHKRKTPVHFFLTQETPCRSIMLSPLPQNLSSMAVIDTSSRESSTETSGNQSPDENSQASTAISGQPEIMEGDQQLEVLLSVQLESDFLNDDDDDGRKKEVRAWCEWVRNIPLGAKRPKIQAIYKSCSTLVLLSMPIVLWDLLPENAAYSFISFVRSDNLAPSLLVDDGDLAIWSWSDMDEQTKTDVAELEGPSPPPTVSKIRPEEGSFDLPMKFLYNFEQPPSPPASIASFSSSKTSYSSHSSYLLSKVKERESAWSVWEWNDQWGCEYRYRVIAETGRPGKY